MKIKQRLLVIAKDGYPLEIVNKKGHPIRNFIHGKIRTLLHGDHLECWKCYEDSVRFKVK